MLLRYTSSSNFLRNKSLIFLIIARMSTTIASQMLTVAVGWQIYSITKDPFYLGLVGLVQFLPMLLLTLVVGHAADRYNRKVIVCTSLIVEGVGIFLLALGSFHGWISKERILLFIFFIGTAGAFQGPPMQALLPNIVTKEVFPRATALMSSVSEFTVIIGPSLGGFLYSLGPGTVYSISGSLIILASILIFFIVLKSEQTKPDPATLKSLFAGITFIKSRPIILGAISLDLFAVLFGGATALLPIFAGEILKIGASGLGILRSAPAAGALLMSAMLAKKPLKRKAGRIMFTAVIFFGMSTIVFALSKSFLLSLGALFVLGASDVISVVIRCTLVQTQTPDNMRGRVSAVNLMFIGTSNQLGEFESGLTASWFGAKNAALIGGIGTILVVLLWMRLFPQILKVEKLQQ